MRAGLALSPMNLRHCDLTDLLCVSSIDPLSVELHQWAELAQQPVLMELSTVIRCVYFHYPLLRFEREAISLSSTPTVEMPRGFSDPLYIALCVWYRTTQKVSLLNTLLNLDSEIVTPPIRCSLNKNIRSRFYGDIFGTLKPW